MFGHVLWELFDWPGGIVVGNLIASVIWALPTMIHFHMRLKRSDNSVQVSELAGQIEALGDKLKEMTGG